MNILLKIELTEKAQNYIEIKVSYKHYKYSYIK